MSDSDDDLLALAGIGSDEEMQQDEESDYEPEIKTTSRGRGATKRKVEESEDEDFQVIGDDGYDEEGEQDPYPLEGKFKDAADKAELLAMDEVTREGILYDRMQEKEKYTERRYLALRARQNRAETSTLKKSAPSSKRLRTSKLSELKKQREKKNKRQSRRYDSEDDDDLNELLDEEEDIDDLDGDDDGYYSDEIDTKRKKTVKDDYDDKYYRDATLADINDKVRSTRSALAKLMFRDEFDVVIPGTYVKVNVGSSSDGRQHYKVAKVEAVKRGGKVYDLLGKPSDVYLVLSQGDSKIVSDMKCISDRVITPEEFEVYKRRLAEASGSSELPSLGEVEAKFKELRAMSTRKLTDEDINKMVARREAISVASMDSGNRVKRLGVLREELQVAIERQQTEKIEYINKQIRELTRYTEKNVSSSLSKMDQINLRNKKKDESSIRKAEKTNVGMRQKQMLSKSFSDPFSRLRTNAKLFYTTEQQQKDDDGVKDEENTETKEVPKKVDVTTCVYRRDGVDAIIKDINFDLELSF
ncbi:hypothetical protein CANARDRAFT_27953 [[Candida] arabinofermentans NRRL YB-2248]|uniref:Plus3 domain-containing protein n=1 Tax=[Candida] arabinofermentans NRRL YB-2248 TaxID=983967 RepID=A0A1E4T2G0_9ASCO|nr:hypothetical protein CANARDRAFT_27953 [[Candida] arabinofermentans NRRL YB-2248]